MMDRIVRVGVLGCGEVAQVIHIPTICNMSDYFRITYLCDVSQQAMEHCRQKVNHFSSPKITRSAEEVCASPDVDVVFVINSTEFHVPHAILALKHDKIAFVEKPMAMNLRDVRLLREAEKESKGTVMVGYMRRYAAAFQDAIGEIGGFDQIMYATVRDIIGRNELFVRQSGVFPKYFKDVAKEDMDRRSEALHDMLSEGLKTDLGLPITEDTTNMYLLLGGLGSHDLSAMREALGMPQRVLGTSLNIKNKFWSAMFEYNDFAVSYESGIHDVPIFDAHLEVFSKTKQIKVKYDTPFIKGLPITMTSREDADGRGAFKETVTRRTYEDAYTLEMRELYALAVQGKPVKTTIEDAAEDLHIFQMIMRARASQLACSSEVG